VFLPEEGETWAELDYSQQEFRLLVHFAVRHHLTGAAAARDRYVNDPSTDIHAYTSELTNGALPRQESKTFNYANIYGAGDEELARQLNKPVAEAKKLRALYNEKMPFVPQLIARCKLAAQCDGMFGLFNGARRHFNLWAPGGKLQKGAGPCEREEAVRRARDPGHPWHGRQIWRAETYKAPNVLIQSAAAIQTKLWMRACWREGIIPLLQMHDCLALSVTSPETAEIAARLGEEAIKLEVPMKVDVHFGRSWGDAKHTWEELHAETSPHVEPERTACESPKFSNDSDETTDSAPADDIVISVLNEPTVSVAPHTSEQAPAGDGFDGFGDTAVTCVGHIHCQNPDHDDKEPSCALYSDGHYYCFGCHQHGWIKEDLDIDDDALAKLAAQAAHRDENDERKFKLALDLWSVSKPITNTLAARYLAETRKLDLAMLPTNVEEVLRFHPYCIFGSNGARHPCLVALFRDAESNEPAGIHRIGLTPDAKKIKRLTLGRWAKPRAIKLWPAIMNKLTIGEGIETVFGALQLGAITPPAWAMGPKTDIPNFPVLPGIENLTIVVDKGDAEARTGADICVARYIDAGRRARIVITNHVKDFNDLAILRSSAANEYAS
jgi:hypothetical protein